MAFGTDAGSWTRSWIDSVMGIRRPGPGLPRSASSGSMLVVSLLVGLAYLRTRQRVVT